jgi:sec-independent protein translocase protein TatC
MFLFMEGCVFYYFVIQPTTLDFLLTFLDQVPILGGGFVPIQQNIRLSDLVSFYLGMSLVIGLTFELPLILIFLQKLGISNWRTYRRYRRHFLMAAVVIMAILTPSGDMLTLGMCMIPVVLLYEGGTIVCWLMDPSIPAEPEEDA